MKKTGSLHRTTRRRKHRILYGRKQKPDLLAALEHDLLREVQGVGGRVLMAPSGSFDCVRPVGAHRARIDRCGRSGVGVSSSFASVLRPMGLQEISDTRTSTRRSDGLNISRKKSEEPRIRATFHTLDLLGMLERHDRVEDAFENASV